MGCRARQAISQNQANMPGQEATEEVNYDTMHYHIDRDFLFLIRLCFHCVTHPFLVSGRENGFHIILR